MNGPIVTKAVAAPSQNSRVDENPYKAPVSAEQKEAESEPLRRRGCSTVLFVAVSLIFAAFFAASAALFTVRAIKLQFPIAFLIGRPGGYVVGALLLALAAWAAWTRRWSFAVVTFTFGIISPVLALWLLVSMR